MAANWKHREVAQAGGYARRWVGDHVLAMCDGYVLSHRLALFNVIGYGPHQCHWCGLGVNWRQPWRTALVVDHVDGDKLNNDPTNLVPSCAPCNSLRGKYHEAFERRLAQLAA